MNSQPTSDLQSPHEKKPADWCDKHHQAADRDGLCLRCHEDRIDAQRAIDKLRVESEERQRTQAARHAELERRLGAACIPARFQGFRFDTYATATVPLPAIGSLRKRLLDGGVHA